MDKKESLKSLSAALLNGVYFDLVPILTIPYLITYIQTANLQMVYILSFLFLLGTTFFVILRRLMLGWYWYSHRRFWALLEKKYRPIVLHKNNLDYEKIGTGKVQSIVENGISTWSRTVNDMLWYGSRVIMTFGIGWFVISKINNFLIISFLLLFIVTFVFLIYFRRKKYILDLEQKEIRNLYNAASVRTIMSRIEILYSSKSAKESKSLYEMMMKQFTLGNKTDKYGFYSVVPAEALFILLPYVGTSLYLFLYKPVLTPTLIILLVSFVYFSSRMSTMIWTFIQFIWLAIDNFPDIKKFWDFIDNVPQLKNYEEGENFVHEKGEIELKNVSFSYEK